MRVFILHESPDTDQAASEFAEAAETFNRGLDIRLRFLDVGFEMRRLEVPQHRERAPMELDLMLSRFQPEVVLVLGSGPRLLECVALAAKTPARIAYLYNGESDRTGGAITRLAHVLAAAEDCPLPAGLPDVHTHYLNPGRPVAAALVEVLVKFGKGD
jgi:hypothetical protein